MTEAPASRIPERDDERIVAPNFVTALIDEDLRSGRVRRVVTRFPPEPNGYLHIGHAKAICLDFGVADDYGGHTNLRFDDTNPTTENPEFVDAIKRDVRWLGFDWDEERYASDYFEQLYALAQELIRQGDAYVDSLSEAEIRELRGTVTEPGRASPYRDRTAEESLDLFARMRRGEFTEGEHVLRARIDMSSPNMLMRDPLLYRIRHAHHYRSGGTWHVYPMYDFAHPLSDAIEGVTHSLCTLEFENNREVYDWLVSRLFEEPRPRQIEFARLNLDHTVVSKRKLIRLVREGRVAGWDDPRMPTLAGVRRRGVPPEAIRTFANRVGVTRTNSRTDYGLLEASVRDELNHRAPRVMAVLEPLPLELTNLPEGHEAWLEASLWPHDVPREGTRPLPFSELLWIERDDYREDPPRGWRRLAPGAHVRLRHGPVVRCDEAVRDGDGALRAVRASVVEGSWGANPEGVSVRGVVHWLSQRHALPATFRLYDRLFTDPDPEAGGADFLEGLHAESLQVREGYVEPHAERGPLDLRYQFERQGYFWRDPVEGADARIFNRIVTLKDAWGRRQRSRAAQASAEDERREGSAEAPEPATAGRRGDGHARGAPPASRSGARGTEPRPADAPRRPAHRAGRAPDPRESLDDRGLEQFERYRAAGLGEGDAARLAADPALGTFFEEALQHHDDPEELANWLVNELPREQRGRALSELALTPEGLADLVALIAEGSISSRTAKELLPELVERPADPRQLVRERGLEKIDDRDALRASVRALVADNPDKAAAYRNGKTGLAGFFIGQVMRETGGRADPELVGTMVREELAAPH